MAGNANLGAAKAAKNDEFYTQWNDIENEMQAYLEYDPDVFRDKTILLPCDDPDWSNFTKYFAERFEQLGLKKLISTSYAADGGNGKVFVLEGENEPQWGHLAGDGDFRSEEVTALRDEADMVITNPPFSLFREFVAWLIEGNVDFAVIGNVNAVTYKEVFPLIKENRLWLGATPDNGRIKWFRIPNDAPVKSSVQRTDPDGARWQDVGNSVWFTNIEHGRRHEPLVLRTMEDNLLYGSKRVRETAYVKYDNYDAIEVPETKGVPSDYAGVMGVPVTFLDKYSPEQFEIVGFVGDEHLATKQYGKKEKVVDGQRMKSATGALGCTIRYKEFGAGTFFDVGYPVKQCYMRIFIRHRRLAIQPLSRSRSGRTSPRCKRGLSHVEVRG